MKAILLHILVFLAGICILPAQNDQSPKPENNSNQKKGIQIKPRGTGQTTGHIATLTIENKSNYSLQILPQTCYIPSDGKYQSYVGRIPDGIEIAPGQTAEVPVWGYCTDVRMPPVPMGENMPPITDWIPVGLPSNITATPKFPGDIAPVYLADSEPVPSFEPSHISDIISSPGYSPSKTKTFDGNCRLIVFQNKTHF